LRHADDHDAVASAEARAVLRDDIIFARVGVERNQRNAMSLCKRADGLHEAIV
jgi:hypothetical protein